MLRQLLAQTELQHVIIIDDTAAVKACATLVISEFKMELLKNKVFEESPGA